MAAGSNQISEHVEVRRITLTEKLHEDRHRLHSRIEEIDQVLAALKENPQIQKILDLQIQKILDLLQKTRFFEKS